MAGRDPVNPMWGGRFCQEPDTLIQEMNASISYDQRLYRQDIRGSIVHARMLARQGILSEEDMKAIEQGLLAIEQEIEAGTFPFATELEDIHMNIEARLTDTIGPAAGRLHTARSRNDQVATDLRLWLRDAIDGIVECLEALQVTLVRGAADHAETILPGLTHLQNAQPVTLGHHLLAYVEMLERDKGRLNDTRRRGNMCPLGAAALAGTSFPIDRAFTAGELGFEGPMANSLDAVSDRDFVLEFLAAASIAGVHLSRLAEELVLWSSQQFGFITLPDALATGSSIMPQKRNPDVAELIRGKVGRILGGLVGLLTVIKALPLAYAKDLQEDKEPLFDAADTLRMALIVMTDIMQHITINSEAMRIAAGHGHTTATDLADILVQEHNLAFREAHHIVGELVKEADRRDCSLDTVPPDALEAIHPLLTPAIQRRLTLEASVKSRSSFGGTAPNEVQRQVELWKTRLHIS
ncbi:MAG: argininosuccinate lyase [Rhodobacteraceae bacterium]|nr:argininosuccinate lyase [Paracoccaceae bacterium]